MPGLKRQAGTVSYFVKGAAKSGLGFNKQYNYYNHYLQIGTKLFLLIFQSNIVAMLTKTKLANSPIVRKAQVCIA
jgi:hypothetical protein